MHRPPVATGVRVSLEGEHGDGLPTVVHRGTTFVAGELGERYAIRVDNDSAERLEVVVSVDGRDVLTGKRGDFVRQRGYVVEPFGTVVIDGFRRSTEHVAAFRFSDVGDSFTARKGTPQLAGVIGVAVFRERVPTRTAWSARPSGRAEVEHSTSTKRSLDAAPTAPRSSRTRDDGHAGKLGTEFGEDTFSRVVEVPFVRRAHSRPDQRVSLFYDSQRRLAARGVPIDPVIARPWRDEPVGWPAASEARFTAPPPPRR
ncbi:MAG: hypothetical protein IAG13_26890 [Deltaproteobacteria bacterium]|nr:hypothetical protein [Nannocystaceae bacterium]